MYGDGVVRLSWYEHATHAYNEIIIRSLKTYAIYLFLTTV